MRSTMKTRLVLLIAFGRTPTAGGDLMRTVRSQVEKRN